MWLAPSSEAGSLASPSARQGGGPPPHCPGMLWFPSRQTASYLTILGICTTQILAVSVCLYI